MNKVNILIKREYEENRIIGVFENEDFSNRIAKKCGAVVESWEVISSQDDEDTFFLVKIDKEGNIKGLREEDAENIFQIYTGLDIHNNLYTIVLAKDKDNAIKKAVEKRIKMISDNKWPIVPIG